jgi:hypothetical protein
MARHMPIESYLTVELVLQCLNYKLPSSLFLQVGLRIEHPQELINSVQVRLISLFIMVNLFLEDAHLL